MFNLKPKTSIPDWSLKKIEQNKKALDILYKRKSKN